MGDVTPRIIVDGLAFPESPRWHDGMVWFSEKRAGRVVRVTPAGVAETVATVPGEPSGLGWLPDGSLLVVSMVDRRLLRLEAGDELWEVADLRSLTSGKCNDMVVDRQGRAYVGHFGYDMFAGEPPALASLVLVSPDGEARVVAEGLDLPNGAVITPDGATLVVAETGSRRLTAFSVGEGGSLSGRRVFAELGDVVPDGICLDAGGAVWVADPAGNQVVRVFGGGEIATRVPTGSLGAFGCALGGEDGRTLFICTYPAEAATDPTGRPDGQLLAVRVDVPGAGSP